MATSIDWMAAKRPPGSRLFGRSQRRAVAAMLSACRKLPAALLVALITWPLIAVITEATRDLQGTYDTVSRIRGIGSIFFNTLLMSLGSLALAMVIGVGLALCASRLSERMYKVAYIVGSFPLFVPALAIVMGWFFIFSPRVGYGNALLRATPLFDGPEGPINVYTLWFIIGVTGLNLASFVFMFVATALRGADPALEAAAYVSGAGWFHTQIQIVLPAIKPALYYSTVIVFLLSLGQFTAPLLLGSNAGIDVITTSIFRLTGASPPNVAGAAMLAVPVMALSGVLVVAQRRALGRLDRYASTSKGTGYSRRPRRLPALAVFAYAFVAVIPPLTGLVLVSLSNFWSQSVDWESLSFDNYRVVFDNPTFRRATLSTIQTVSITVVLSVVVSFFVAHLLVKRRLGVLGRALDLAVTLPIAVPGIIFGLGVLLSFGSPSFGLYGSRTLFVLAWLIVVLPHGVRLLAAALSQIGPDPLRAARVAGSSSAHAMLRVTLPTMRRPLAAAAMLAFVLLTQEFAAASMVRTTTNQTLSTLLYQTWDSGIYAMVATQAMVMVFVSVGGAAVVLLLGGRNRAGR
jgi:iron(III) transport system permease protein